MDATLILEQARDAMTVRRVFGEPIEQQGVVVVPVAAIRGGTGFGGGHDDRGNEGGGGGFGVSARPVGVYRIQNGEVGWTPAVDLTRIILGGQLVAIAFLLTVRAIFKRRR